MNVLKIWELHYQLAKAVKNAHDEVGLNNGGHDFDHALRVAQMAFTVAYDHCPYFAEMAGVAGLLHNNDRILERKLKLKSENISAVSDEDVVSMARSMLIRCIPGLAQREELLIIEAVLDHGSKPNNPNDHLVMIALADADRLINMEADEIIRAGQCHADLPVLDPVHIEATPGANYRDPKTVLWDIAHCISWAADEGPYILRLPLSRKLGKQRADYLRQFIETIKRQRADLGLLPYPEM
jgi:hypothetical protein